MFDALDVGLVDPARLLLEGDQDADLPEALEREPSYKGHYLYAYDSIGGCGAHSRPR